MTNVWNMQQPANTKIVLGSWYEYGGIFDRGQPGVHRQDVVFGGVIATPVGPLMIGYSVGQDNTHRLSMSVGYRM
jgi:outer membrane translocation and assembly module TamA